REPDKGTRDWLRNGVWSEECIVQGKGCVKRIDRRVQRQYCARNVDAGDEHRSDVSAEHRIDASAEHRIARIAFSRADDILGKRCRSITMSGTVMMMRKRIGATGDGLRWG